VVDPAIAGLKEGKNLSREVALSRIQTSICRNVAKNLASLASQFGASVNHGLEFNECSQLFIGLHNVTLPVVAMPVCNPDRSPVGINR
jgi:hypothetical protein